MDGHTGWKDGAPCHPEIFIHVLDISAEIRDRPQQKWTPGLFSLSRRVGADMGSPKLSEFKGVHVYVPHSDTLGLFTGPVDILIAASEDSHDLAPVSLQLHLTPPWLTHTGQHPCLWFLVLKCDRLLLPQAAEVGWDCGTLCPNISPGWSLLVAHPQTSVHMFSMATFSDMAFLPTTFIS